MSQSLTGGHSCSFVGPVRADKARTFDGGRGSTVSNRAASLIDRSDDHSGVRTALAMAVSAVVMSGRVRGEGLSREGYAALVGIPLPRRTLSLGDRAAKTEPSSPPRHRACGDFSSHSRFEYQGSGSRSAQQPTRPVVSATALVPPAEQIQMCRSFSTLPLLSCNSSYPSNPSLMRGLPHKHPLPSSPFALSLPRSPSQPLGRGAAPLRDGISLDGSPSKTNGAPAVTTAAAAAGTASAVIEAGNAATIAPSSEIDALAVNACPSVLSIGGTVESMTQSSVAGTLPAAVSPLGSSDDRTQHPRGSDGHQKRPALCRTHSPPRGAPVAVYGTPTTPNTLPMPYARPASVDTALLTAVGAASNGAFGQDSTAAPEVGVPRNRKETLLQPSLPPVAFLSAAIYPQSFVSDVPCSCSSPFVLVSSHHATFCSTSMVLSSSRDESRTICCHRC